MKIEAPPKTIMINGKRVEVQLDEVLVHKGLLGQCMWSGQRITYAPDQGNQMLVDTLFHEVVHFISKETDLELSERQTGVVTSMLLGFFSANPEFVSWAIDTWLGKRTKDSFDLEADSAGDYK